MGTIREEYIMYETMCASEEVDWVIKLPYVLQRMHYQPLNMLSK